MTSLALLRAAPLLGATSSLTFTVCEDFFIRPLIVTDADLRLHNNRVLPTHGRWLWGGLSIVFTMYPLSIATALANLTGASSIYNAHECPREAASFYWAGLAFSVLHFVWGPRAMGLLGSIRRDENIEGDKSKDNTAAMEAWVRVNAVRGILADLPGWVCYFIAFVTATSRPAQFDSIHFAS